MAKVDLAAQVEELTAKVEELTAENTELHKQIAQASPPPAVKLQGQVREIKLVADAALGNGDRKKGATLAFIQLADSVEVEEVITALRNLELITW